MRAFKFILGCMGLLGVLVGLWFVPSPWNAIIAGPLGYGSGALLADGIYGD